MWDHLLGEPGRIRHAHPPSYKEPFFIFLKSQGVYNDGQIGSTRAGSAGARHDWVGRYLRCRARSTLRRMAPNLRKKCIYQNRGRGASGGLEHNGALGVVELPVSQTQLERVVALQLLGDGGSGLDAGVEKFEKLITPPHRLVDPPRHTSDIGTPILQILADVILVEEFIIAPSPQRSRKLGCPTFFLITSSAPSANRSRSGPATDSLMGHRWPSQRTLIIPKMARTDPTGTSFSL